MNINFTIILKFFQENNNELTLSSSLPTYLSTQRIKLLDVHLNILQTSSSIFLHKLRNIVFYIQHKYVYYNV